MSTVIISSLVGLLCTSISSVVTFLLTKKKYDEEVDAAHLKDLGDAFERYKALTDEMYKSQDKKIEALQEENANLKQQVNDLQKQIIELLSAVCLDVTCKLRKSGLPSGTALKTIKETNKK